MLITEKKAKLPKNVLVSQRLRHVHTLFGDSFHSVRVDIEIIIAQLTHACAKETP